MSSSQAAASWARGVKPTALDAQLEAVKLFIFCSQLSYGLNPRSCPVCTSQMHSNGMMPLATRCKGLGFGDKDIYVACRRWSCKNGAHAHAARLAEHGLQARHPALLFLTAPCSLLCLQ